MAPSSKRERERRLAAKRALKAQKRSQRMAARGPGQGDSASGNSGELFDEGFGAPGTVFLTAPLIRELSQLREWPIDTLLVARSRGGYWSRQQDSVLLPFSPVGTGAPEDPHDAYISELASPERRSLLKDQGDDSASTIHRTVSCSYEGCEFRVRFESVCVVGECLSDLPVLVHNEQAETCDNCLEESWHQLELGGVARCAHCGSVEGGFVPASGESDGESEAESDTESEESAGEE